MSLSVAAPLSESSPDRPLLLIQVHAEATARALIAYLESNRAQLSDNYLTQVEQVVVTLRKLQPELEGFSPVFADLFERVQLVDALPYRVQGLEAFKGESPEGLSSPFQIIAPHTDAAARTLCQVLETRKGSLDLIDCVQIRQVYRNFHPLLEGGGLSLPHLLELQRLIFPQGNPEHHDAYMQLVRGYASPLAKEASEAEVAAANSSINAPAQSNEVPANQGGLGAQLRELLVRAFIA